MARPESPSRCTLPITAFRVTFPSSAAIWLAESPASQSFFSCSTRSSDQVNTVIAFFPSHRAGQPGRRWRRHWCRRRRHSPQKSLRSESLSPRRARFLRPNVYALQNVLLGSEPPHEMSYPTAEKLQYGRTRAQESAPVRPHVPASRHCSACFAPHRNPTELTFPALQEGRFRCWKCSLVAC